MRHYQQRSDATKHLLIDQPEQYALVTLGETNLICYRANPQQPKIVLTDDMLPRIVRYYHLTAQHAEGMDRLEWSLKRHFYHLRLRDKVCSQVSRCKICQKMKCYSTNFAQLPAREATSVPWEQVHVDLIGPWNIKVKRHKKPVQFIALMCINPVLNLLEVETVKDKMSEQVTKTFESREATSVPWEQVHVDLIGPWNIKVKRHKKPVQFIALMCINPVLNLLEVETVKDKMSEQVTKTFESREATSVPWEQVHVDLISPWNIKVKRHKKPVQFIALMCINPVLNLLEVETVKDKMSEQVTKTFEHLWLSRYPRPRTCIHDCGPEFVAHEFQTVLEDTGIGSRPTSTQNPQSN
jgi:uncharacterized membrane protein YiaA